MKPALTRGIGWVGGLDSGFHRNDGEELGDGRGGYLQGMPLRQHLCGLRISPIVTRITPIPSEDSGQAQSSSVEGEEVRGKRGGGLPRSAPTTLTSILSQDEDLCVTGILGCLHPSLYPNHPHPFDKLRAGLAFPRQGGREKTGFRLSPE